MGKSKISVKAIRAADPKRVAITLSLSFDADDPKAPHAYKGLGLLLHEMLTEEEAREFMRQFERERAKVAKAAKPKKS